MFGGSGSIRFFSCFLNAKGPSPFLAAVTVATASSSALRSSPMCVLLAIGKGMNTPGPGLLHLPRCRCRCRCCCRVNPTPPVCSWALPALARCSVLKYALLSPTPPAGRLGFLVSDFHPFSSKRGQSKAKQSSRDHKMARGEDGGPVVSEGVRRESMEKGNGGNQEGTPPTERTKDDEKK